VFQRESERETERECVCVYTLCVCVCVCVCACVGLIVHKCISKVGVEGVQITAITQKRSKSPACIAYGDTRVMSHVIPHSILPPSASASGASKELTVQWAHLGPAVPRVKAC
jgi:hypothetical protein